MDLERRVAIRYLGAGPGERYAAKHDPNGFVVRLEPGELRTWDFADDRWN